MKESLRNFLGIVLLYSYERENTFNRFCCGSLSRFSCRQLF